MVEAMPAVRRLLLAVVGSHVVVWPSQAVSAPEPVLFGVPVKLLGHRAKLQTGPPGADLEGNSRSLLSLSSLLPHVPKMWQTTALHTHAVRGSTMPSLAR